VKKATLYMADPSVLASIARLMITMSGSRTVDELRYRPITGLEKLGTKGWKSPSLDGRLAIDAGQSVLLHYCIAMRVPAKERIEEIDACTPALPADAIREDRERRKEMVYIEAAKTAPIKVTDVPVAIDCVRGRVVIGDVSAVTCDTVASALRALSAISDPPHSSGLGLRPYTPCDEDMHKLLRDLSLGFFNSVRTMHSDVADDTAPEPEDRFRLRTQVARQRSTVTGRLIPAGDSIVRGCVEDDGMVFQSLGVNFGDFSCDLFEDCTVRAIKWHKDLNDEVLDEHAGDNHSLAIAEATLHAGCLLSVFGDLEGALEEISAQDGDG